MNDAENQKPDMDLENKNDGQAEPSHKEDALESYAAAKEKVSEEVQAQTETNVSEEPPTSQSQAPDAAVPHGGAWSSLFNGLAAIAPLTLILAIACLAWHDFLNPAKAVYCPAEIKSITAFLHSVAQSSWLAPTALENGAWSLPQWPAFYWWIGLIAFIPGLESWLLPLAEALAALLAVLGVWGLAHAAGFGLRAAFAGAVVLLCTPIFAPLPHFMGPAPFAAGCLLLALICFCHGWLAKFSFFSLPLAFIFTALAGLAGGLLHFALPLLASLVFLIWHGNFKRAHSLDAILGFVLMLAIIGGWLGWLSLAKDTGDYLPRLFGASMDFNWPPHELWWLAILLGILGSLPWLLSVLGVSWLQVIRQSGTALKQSRNGSAFVWISFVLALCLSIFSTQFHMAAVAIACLASILLGKAILHLNDLGNRFFYLLASLLLLLAGFVLLGLHFDFSQAWIMSLLPLTPPEIARSTLLSLSALPIVAAILIAGGLFGFFFVKRDRRSGGLVYGLLLTIILTQVCRLILVPELAADPKLPLKSYAAILSSIEHSGSAMPPAPIEEAAPAVQAPTPVPTLPGISGDTPVLTPAPDASNSEINQSDNPETNTNSDADSTLSAQPPAEKEEIIIEEVVPSHSDLHDPLTQDQNTASEIIVTPPEALQTMPQSNIQEQTTIPAPIEIPATR